MKQPAQKNKNNTTPPPSKGSEQGILSHIKSFFDNLKRTKFGHAEHGRSMTEMLGVLAIIGVLSIGGIMGYHYAITHYKTNEIINELDMRVVALVSFLHKNIGLTPGQTLVMEMGPVMRLGYRAAAKLSERNRDYFEIHVNQIDSKTCRKLTESYTVPNLILINGKMVNDILVDCGTEEVDMDFIYKNNLASKDKCYEKGYFDLGSLSCRCAGNTYLDEQTKDCKCPSGHVWSKVEKTCVESICQEGEFESLSGGCLPCDIAGSHMISGTAQEQLCVACPERLVVKYGKAYCARKCEKGYFRTSLGTCQACTFKNSIYISSEPTDTAGCNACPGRHATVSEYYGASHCVEDDYCNNKNSFRGTNDDGGSTCIPCDTTKKVWVGIHPIEQKLCTSCQSSDGVPIREYQNGWCIRTVCQDDEFKGADGACYKCSEGQPIRVGENSGCESPTCGRTILDNMCLIDNCPSVTHVKLANGACYDCSQTDYFSSTYEECELGCQSTGRRWTDKGFCKLNTCILGKNVPYEHKTNECFSCMGIKDGVSPTGESPWAQEYCTACGNYITNGACYRSDSCDKGTSFRALRSGYLFCTDCVYTQPVKIGNHPKHRDMCLGCQTHRRFYDNDTCYRCDSPEKPIVNDSAQIQSCLACGIRQVVNNKCVLKQ